MTALVHSWFTFLPVSIFYVKGVVVRNIFCIFLVKTCIFSNNYNNNNTLNLIHKAQINISKQEPTATLTRTY